MKFIKTTLIGGVLFLLPIVVLIVVVQKAFDVMLKVAKPLADHIPIDSVAGVALVNVIAAAIVVLVCFLAGLLSQAGFAKSLSTRLDNRLREDVPGYAMVRGIAANLKTETEDAMRPVKVRFDDHERVGMVQRPQEGRDRIIVYLPGSPNPWTGTIAVVEAKRVEFLPGHLKDVLGSVEGFGDGLDDLLDNEKHES